MEEKSKTLVIGAIAVFGAQSAAAQDGSWGYDATFHCWFSGMTTSGETDAGAIESEASASDSLAEVGQVERKNLALEALKKLLNDEIRSRSKSNVIETRKFSERLEAAIAHYHTNAISTVEVLQELIALAKEVRDARNRGEETELTPEEVAFYDALADNQSVVDILGYDQLKIIAHELLKGLKANVSVDWAHRDSARARLRVLVKRILRRFGYPPDLEDAAFRGVLAQAEALLSAEGIA